MDPLKRKKNEEEKVRLKEAYEEFRETFEDGAVKISKTFIRGDVVNPDKSIPNTGPTIYKPSLPIQIKSHKHGDSKVEAAKKIAEQAAKKIMEFEKQEEEKHHTVHDHNRPPKPGTKKIVEKSRLSNLEAFKEELKQMQAMRDERKGLRQHLKEKMGVPEDELNRIAPALDTPYFGTGVPANVDYENDPTTTNLYVCNLPADTKIEDFFETFGSFGPLASAKILYPKPDEERYRNTLSGFVAFMARLDAERALCSMNGDVIRGCELRVSWARSVMIPPMPFHVPPPLRELAMPDPPSGLPFNAKPLSDDLRDFLKKYHNLPKLNAPLDTSDAEMINAYKKMIENATVRVVIPTEKPLLHLIHRVVEFLVRCGPLFEAVLMAKERQNPMYRFLFDNHHPTHVYFRWRLYTVLQGDDRQKWRMDKFRMFEGGSWWQPPPHALFELGMPAQLYDTAYVPKRRRSRVYEKRKPLRRRHSSGDIKSDEESRDKKRWRALQEDLKREEKQRRLKGVLNDKEREELEELLRNITPDKVSVGDAMIWCLDHAEFSKEISQCIFESLCIKETPLYKKIARIYLVSDILANCAVRVKDAFYYRQHIGEYLGKIFMELSETLESIDSRLKTEQFRQRVMLCFRNWEDHALYPTQELIQWQNVFLGLLKNGAETDSSLDGEPMPADVDLDEDLDGVPMPDPDLDGVAMEEEEKQSGGEEEDIDGLPMEEEAVIMPSEPDSKRPPTPDNRFTTGSWSTIEPDEPVKMEKPGKSKWESIGISRWDHHGNVSSAFTQENELEDERLPQRKRHKLSRLSPSPPLTAAVQAARALAVAKAAQLAQINALSETNSVNDEERRKLLRDIEVKVMKLQDVLEADGNIPSVEIESELNKYRQKLMIRMEEKLCNKAKESFGKANNNNVEIKNSRQSNREHKESENSNRRRHHSPSDKTSSGRRDSHSGSSSKVSSRDRDVGGGETRRRGEEKLSSSRRHEDESGSSSSSRRERSREKAGTDRERRDRDRSRDRERDNRDDRKRRSSPEHGQRRR